MRAIQSLRFAVFVALLQGAAVVAQTPPLPAADFTRPAFITEVRLSPSGEHLAMLMQLAGKYRGLAVMGLNPRTEPKLLVAFGNADVTSVLWVNDQRLVFEAFERGAVIREGGAGTHAIDRDGSNLRQLIAWQYSIGTPGSNVHHRLLPYGWFLHGTIDDGSADVFVHKRATDARGEPTSVQLARLDTLTGTLRTLAYDAPKGASDWHLDAKGEPRLLTTYDEGRNKLFWRKPGSSEWRELANHDPFGDDGFVPWNVDADGSVLVMARRNGDTTGLYPFDPATNTVSSQAAVAIAGYDLAPQAEIDGGSGRLLGLHYLADRPGSVWFDPALQRIQDGIDAAMPPGRHNRLYCGRCSSTRFFVVHSASDRQPGEYFLFDREKTTLERIAANRPWIDEATQGRTTLHRVEVRDGLEVPLYVTHPVGAADDTPLPAVMLVHGGPWLRGASLRWNAEAQFLASRGWRVLQPEFRGSEGYGYKLFRAGWKQWGSAMQDDLVDTLRWAAQRKLVDPARVCLYGSSYGGYAALMAPIVHPGVFRCAASFAAVTDIGLMYSVAWSDFSEASKRYSMPVLVGDPDKDAAMLDAASPLKRAAELKIPVLLVHGAADWRVPLVHSRQFASAARSAGVEVEQHVYSGEGHGFNLPDNHSDFLLRLERFLARSLTGARPAQ